MVVTVPGMVSDVSALLAKAYVPMVSSPVGSVSEVSPAFLKALAPMLVKFGPRVSDVKVELANEPDSMVRMLGRTTLPSDLPLKLPMLS